MKQMKLLRKRPYTIAHNSSRYKSLRVNLSPKCGLEVGQKVYQFLRDDGVIELVPEEKISQEFLDSYVI